jgi:hypothetical protein
MQSVHPIRTEEPLSTQSVEEQLALAFAPLHKRAFGTAIGLASAVVIIMMTLAHVILRPDPAPDIGLLRFYFYGYSVSWLGALIGGFWAFVAGFVAGWFVAFCRNFVVAISVFLTRARAELMQTRDFLDHI